MRIAQKLPCALQNAARCVLLLGLFLPQFCSAGGPPPVITVQPVSQTAPLLGIVTFSVTATSDTTMSYQWFKEGTALYGATSSSYTILTVLGTSSGNYYVKVTNAGGSVLSDNATLNVMAPPGILTQPQSQTVDQGQDASFSVVADGTGPLSYRWFFNGSSLGPAGTTATLTLTNIAPGQTGNYWVVLTNSMGAVTSAVATLTVVVPPQIVTEPHNLSVVAGQNASFFVAASGSGSLSYQWFLNGAPLSGATAETLTLTNVQAAQSGGYTVCVTNPAGSITTSPATLTVSPPVVTLSVAPGAALSPAGFAFQLSVPAGSTYVIWASSDFKNWAPIVTNLAATGTILFTDPAAANYPRRLYRAVAQ